MTTWLLCTLAFSALAALSAHLLEAALPNGWPRRHIWTGAVLISSVVPAAALISDGAWPAGLLPQTATVDLSILDTFSGDVITGSVPTAAAPPSVDAAFVIRTGWLLLSLLVLVGYTAVWLRFLGAVGEWRRGRLCNQPIRISTATGPAVFGVRRPTIVVPSWVLTSTPAVQRVIMLHEAEHARARDHVLLALAPLAAIAMPWNLPLWWQLHRMRLAVEVDCDTRVLRRGVAVREYGTLLIDIASRSRYMPASLAALAEPRTLLERRILAMSNHTARSRTRTGLLIAAAALLVTTAFETFTLMTPPAAGITTVPFTANVVPTQLAQKITAAADTPLVVIDGEIVGSDAVEARLAGVDVVNIEMIKAADATERYGARAADGVIVITTSRNAAARRAVTVQGERSASGAGGTIEQRRAMTATATGGTGEFRVSRIVRDSAAITGGKITAYTIDDAAAAGATGGRIVLRQSVDSQQPPPLVIVDGVVMGNYAGNLGQHLDPNSIESINVIKGEAAERLYGARGANGVIQIKTRK